MRIIYIGGGFVGACSAAVSADSGHDTLVFDVDRGKVAALGSFDRERIESYIFEDGLADLMIRNRERLRFTDDYGTVAEALEHADAVFMCLPTPEIGETGESDLSYYVAAAEQLAAALARRNGGRQEKYIVVVNKSTVPINMIDQTAAILDRHGVKNYGVVSNPEFLVEGKAVDGSIRPDRVVVGAAREGDFAVMRQVYQRFYSSTAVKYIETSPAEAAAGKLLANYVLFNRLAVCFDVIGRTCETFPDLNFEKIRSILISEPRIGSWGLYDSLYAGGSCFIKDARSLSHQLQAAGQNATLVNETYLANKRQLELFLGRPETENGFAWRGREVAVLGLAFKQDTNDVRNSPSIGIVHFLKERGVKKINLYDPAAGESFRRLFPHDPLLDYHDSEDGAIKDATAIIIATDWPQFRGLDALLLSQPASGRLIMDGRRILQSGYQRLREHGYVIIAVGSPVMKA